MPRPLALIALVPCLAVAVALAVAGCGGGEKTSSEPVRTVNPKPPPRPAPRRVRRPRCPSGAANCRSAIGRVVYVEAKDPDGDGDAHLVLASTQSVTGPGLTVIDVERDLRPHPLPRVGDLVAAAGPVYRGSHGQRQIQATVIRVGRSR